MAKRPIVVGIGPNNIAALRQPGTIHNNCKHRQAAATYLFDGEVISFERVSESNINDPVSLFWERLRFLSAASCPILVGIGPNNTAAMPQTGTMQNTSSGQHLNR